jgi:hypothetical protein
MVYEHVSHADGHRLKASPGDLLPARPPATAGAQERRRRKAARNQPDRRYISPNGTISASRIGRLTVHDYAFALRHRAPVDSAPWFISQELRTGCARQIKGMLDAPPTPREAVWAQAAGRS